MKSAISWVLIGTCMLLLAPPRASATTVTINIGILRLNHDNPARVSIFAFIPVNTACPVNGWFAYDNADTGLGLVWTKGLLAAYQTNKPIRITGTGTCDQFGVEQIQMIELFAD